MSLEQSAEEQVPAAERVAGPATSPVYVLVGSDGSVVASTEVFNRLVGAHVIGAGAVGSAVVSIINGSQELLGLNIDGPTGDRLDIRVEAVLNGREQRLALIELQVPRPADGRDAAIGWFETFAAGSPAIVWLKDLDGAYAYVNRQYTTELGADPATVVGHTDADLTQLEAIDGPRSKGGLRGSLTLRKQAAEPLSLEYTIPAFDRRPAYAALRFPLLDPAGTPLVVCGVASPADHSELAKHECEHLLEAARWYQGDALELRQAAMEEWGIKAVRPQGSLELDIEDEAASAAEVAETAERAAAAERARVALEDRITALQAQVATEHNRAADLEGSLTDARGRADALAASLEVANTRAGTVDTAYSRIRELESMVATASSAGVAAAQSAGRVMELEHELRTLREALEHERSQRVAVEADAGRGQVDVDQERARHDAEVRAIEERHRIELQRAADQREAEQRSAAEQRDRALQLAAEQRDAELRAAEERREEELGTLEERFREELAAASGQHHGELTGTHDQHRSELAAIREQHESELAAVHEQLQSERVATHEQHVSELVATHEQHVSELVATREQHESELVATREQHESELTAAREQHESDLAAARGALELQRSTDEHHEGELTAAQDRIRMELNAANQRHQAEVSHLRGEHAALADEQRSLAERERHAQARIRELEELAAGAGAASATAAEASRRSGEAERRASEAERRADAAEEQMRFARSEAELTQQRLRDAESARQQFESQIAELTDQLTQAHSHIDDLEAGLHASRDQIARLERAAAAATAAAAGPIYQPAQRPGPARPGSLPSAQPESQPFPPQTPAVPTGAPPLQPSPPQAPPAPEPGFVQEERVLAPVAQLGWDPAAQQGLATALRGCLNLRSILSESVRLIGTGGGWDVVVAWLPNESEGKFSCSATWVRSPVDMARLETSMWQVRQSANASAVGAAATSSDIVWINNPGSDGDRHLASVKAEGINTVVLVPVRQQGQVFAVLELCTEGSAQESPEADAALRSIEVEISAANQRLVDAASANQWGRRRR